MHDILTRARERLMADLVTLPNLEMRELVVHEAYHPPVFAAATAEFITDEKLLEQVIADNPGVLDAWDSAGKILDEMDLPHTWKNLQAACVVWHIYHELQRHLTTEGPVVGPHIVFVEIEDDRVDLVRVL